MILINQQTVNIYFIAITHPFHLKLRGRMLSFIMNCGVQNRGWQ